MEQVWLKRGEGRDTGRVYTLRKNIWAQADLYKP